MGMVPEAFVSPTLRKKDLDKLNKGGKQTYDRGKQTYYTQNVSHFEISCPFTIIWIR